MPNGPKGQRPRETLRRVVVTGLGAVTAAGWGVTAFRKAARSGRTAIGPLTRLPHELQRTHVAGEVPEPSGESRWQARRRRSSNAERFALFAAIEAIERAGLTEELAYLSAGVFFGSSTGGLSETERFYQQLVDGAPAGGDRVLLASHHLCAPAEAVARHLRVAGPVETISSACASAGLAIEQAWQSVGRGEVDVAIAGGADTLTLTTYFWIQLAAGHGRAAVPAVSSRPQGDVARRRWRGARA